MSHTISRHFPHLLSRHHTWGTACPGCLRSPRDTRAGADLMVMCWKKKLLLHRAKRMKGSDPFALWIKTTARRKAWGWRWWWRRRRRLCCSPCSPAAGRARWRTCCASWNEAEVAASARPCPSPARTVGDQRSRPYRRSNHSTAIFSDDGKWCFNFATVRCESSSKRNSSMEAVDRAYECQWTSTGHPNWIHSNPLWTIM